MDNFSNNLSYVDSPSLLYVGIAVSLLILEVPALVFGVVWWLSERKANTVAPEGLEERDHSQAA